MNFKDAPKKLQISTETVNENMEAALKRAKKKLMADNGINPMLEVVVVHDRKGTLTLPMLNLGEIPNDRKGKAKALYQVGREIGKNFGNDLLITQVTLLSEGWQREKDKETGNVSERVEVLFAATQTWDGREGVLSQRIVRETDGDVLGTVDSEENWATDDEADDSNPLLKIFYVGFATGSVRARGTKSEELIEVSNEVEALIGELFSE